MAETVVWMLLINVAVWAVIPLTPAAFNAPFPRVEFVSSAPYTMSGCEPLDFLDFVFDLKKDY